MAENNVQSNSVKDPRITWGGCSVLLDVNNGDRLVFSCLSAGATLKIGNKNCSLRPLIGCPFGSLFQIDNGEEGPYLSRVLPSTEDDNNKQENGDCQVPDESRDNREIIDNNKAQSLTGDDIDELQRQGAKGDEIVEALIANSATFEKKTLFSQEKYRLKKQKKYAPTVLLRRPIACSICEAYFKKYPDRIRFLRVDALSLLLSMANDSANSDVLVVDMVGGLLTGSVAERLGGTGYVCNTYLGDTPYSMDIVRIFNFSDEICKRIVRCPLSDFSLTQNGTSEQNYEQADPCNMELNEEISSAVSAEETSPSSHQEDSGLLPESTVSPGSKIGKAPKAGEQASQEVIKTWKENGFSSVILAASDLDPWNLVKDILPLLSYSAPFAIYHQYLQPLATCMHSLQVGKLAIGLQISEPWLREYQVLPSRSHPCMQMNAFGGILSGIKICSS
ncbi:tRNA (adenine(58)-N(1))-methyltransferase non-catalytic subunit trm6-like isoform X2 [Tripterygium wilfordii]|uniref:tRNA (adenine(58)-N(1))-methyltransferase non-catalytic subunit trm6-like isoform X2 n=1 Tax=Tripterygium wilfordii TaxID=458696 RepID=UPI0018F841AF|nr:tRNA (adenine(58)-N(1))-methyltransferase non-catalytic subunit trm6-like isoform X2 [Tripterygium wilfordii]